MILKQHGCNGQLIGKEIALPPAPLVTRLTVIDQYGDPLEGVHIQRTDGMFPTITNQHGIAHVEVLGDETFTFSHIGKETRTLSINNLRDGVVVLEDTIEDLDEVIVISKPKVNNTAWWIIGAIAVGSLFYMKKKPKKVNL